MQRERWRAVVVLIGTIGLFASLLGGGAIAVAKSKTRPPLTAAVSVSRNGVVVRIQTSRPKARCSVLVSVARTSQRLPVVFTNAKGAASISWAIDSNAPSGTWSFNVGCSVGRKAYRVTRQVLLINRGTGTGSISAPDSVKVTAGTPGGQGSGACPASAAEDQNGKCVSFPGDPYNGYQGGTDVGQCTWYAAGRRSDLWGITTGNANQWLAQAAGHDAEGTTPVVGAVAVRTAGQWGHVAYVVGISSSGQPLVDDSNYENDLIVHYSHAVLRVLPGLHLRRACWKGSDDDHNDHNDHSHNGKRQGNAGDDCRSERGA